MSVDVAILDYGVGNLFSVRRAFEHCGATVVVSRDANELLNAPRLVLPGVGAFADGMRGLSSRGLGQLPVQFAATGKPLLGICLGMQMLSTISEEFGEHRGLDIVSGRVVPIPGTTSANVPHKIPYIGWAALCRAPGIENWGGTLLESVGTDDAVYLVHSFAVKPEQEKYRLADYDYNGRAVCAAIRKDNVYGLQFHPEKSGTVGLRILRKFLKL